MKAIYLLGGFLNSPKDFQKVLGNFNDSVVKFHNNKLQPVYHCQITQNLIPDKVPLFHEYL